MVKAAEEVVVPVGPQRLAGLLTIPDPTTGIVVFAHGSGSSRHSRRNQFVAAELNRAGLATLLFDLLSTDEEQDRANVFDIELLGGRLSAVCAWVGEHAELADQPLGLFGASTGAAAALWVAARPQAGVSAVVSRGGRPDLAGPWLPQVTAPTLLIVGGADTAVLPLNESARAGLGGEAVLEVVPGATHLFPEPGALERVAELAENWFTEKLSVER